MASMKGRINDYNKSLNKNEREANARNAGKISGETRIKKKVIRDALSELLAEPVSTVPMAQAVASVYGIKDDITIKQLYIVGCVMNTIKAGTVKDIVALCDLLNEKPDDNSDAKLQMLIDAMKSV